MIGCELIGWDYRSRGIESPTLRDSTFEMRNIAARFVAPTVLDHFGVAIPEHYYGVSRAAGAFFGNPDINGDGSISGDGTGTFENDDVVAFVSLWLLPNTIQAPNAADLNLDGIADLQDWGILNASDPSMGQAVLFALSGGSLVPEPSTVSLSLLVILLKFAAYRPSRDCRPDTGPSAA